MRRLLGIVSILLFSNSIIAQIDNCYTSRVTRGDSLFSLKRFEDAKVYYNEATFCVDKPDDLSELKKKIRQTENEINKLKIKEFSLSWDYVWAESIGTKGNVSITLKNISRWNYEEKDCPSWLSIEKTKSGFLYECQPNNQPAERACSIKFKAGNITKTFIVQQGKAKEYLILSPTSIQSSSQGSEHVVSVNTNALTGFEITSGFSWAKVSSSQNSVTINLAENEKYDPRYGNIYVRTKSCVETIRVKQEAKPSNFLLDVVALRILSDFELSMSFRLKSGGHIQFDAGFWDILRRNNLSGGFSASYIWTYEFTDMWSLHYGIGLGLGGVRRPYAEPVSRFVVAAVPSVGVECAPDGWNIAGRQVGLTLDYRPYIGTDCIGFYHNLTNINLGVRLHLH